MEYEKRINKTNITGFVAYYNGSEIASSTNFRTLAENEKVKELLGKEGFIIKHTVSEGIVAVY